jgi:hypothetical protein
MRSGGVPWVAQRPIPTNQCNVLEILVNKEGEESGTHILEDLGLRLPGSLRGMSMSMCV